MRPIPSLEDLANDPSRIVEVPAEGLLSVVLQCQALAQAAALRLGSINRTVDADDRTEVVDAGGVATLIGRSRSWVYKNKDDLPPQRKVGDKPVWLRSDISAWLKARPLWGD
jgi:predicted DNA-binding transcriptional regulator AlpA